MKIACVILGTRGDVQPMIALASGLMVHGHDVMVCAPPEHAELAGRHHCPFVPFGPDVKEKVKEEPEKQKGGGAVKISLKDGKKLIGDQITLLPDILKGVDLSPIKDIWEDWMGECVILACDKELHGTRTGTLFPFIQTGFMMLPPGIPLPEEVEEFIQKGSPPVNIGFGSNPITVTEKYSALVEQVRDLTNERRSHFRGHHRVRHP